MSTSRLPHERIQRFVDRLAELLGRSVGLDDRHRTFITCSRHFGDEDQLRVDVLVSRRLSEEASDYLYSFSGEPGAPFQVPPNKELGVSTRRCLPVLVDGEVFGYLWLIGEARADEDELITHEMPILAPLLDEGMTGSSREDASAWAAVVRTLCDPTRRRELPGVLDEAGFRREPPVAVLCAYRAQQAHSRSDVGSVLDHAIATRPYHALTRASTCLDGALAIALVTPSHLEDAGQAEAGASVPPPPSDAEFSIGTSDWDAPDLSFGLMRRAALAAYVAAQRRDRSLSWRGSSFDGVLLEAALSDHVQVVPPGVRSLTDTQSNDALVTTAQVFLDEAGDVGATTQRLHIHRTTLYYRLGRIESVTGYSLKSGSDRLSLAVGLRTVAFLATDLSRFLQTT